MKTTTNHRTNPVRRTRVKQSLVIAFACALPACASMQKERGHDDVSRIVERRTGHNTGWEKGAPEARRIAERVSKLQEGGLTRERAVAIALLNSPRLQQSYADLDISQADLVDAGLLSNPTLAGSVGFHIGGPGHAEYEVSLVQSFLDVFMLPLRKRVAEQQFVAATLRVAHSALELASDVSKEFAEVQAAQETLQMLHGITDGAELAADLAQRQFEAGNVSERKVASELATYQQARLDLGHEELRLVERRERLNRLLGLWGKSSAWGLGERLPVIPDRDVLPEELERIAIRQRLDIGAAKREWALLDTALGLARSSRYTGLINVGAHIHQDADGPRLLGPTLAIELPIFNQRQGMIARLEAERQQAARRVEELAVDARSEVRVAAAQLAVTKRASDEYRTGLLPTRARVLEQTQLEYNGMQLGLYELLAAKKEQVEATRAYIDTVRDYWIARAELERALGGKLPHSALSAPPAMSSK
jgi:outer membrane protein, heavy metal efflux system